MEDTLRASLLVAKVVLSQSLNPCFNGRYSQSLLILLNMFNKCHVLILVLMEDTLRGIIESLMTNGAKVLILVLMEDTLRVT